eukprot:c23790_g1_i1 orf=424-1161(-)
MPQGTLYDCLHGLPSEQEPLNWFTRLRIAVGAAKGFSYLHNDCSPAVIHRDVKCSNILLDDNLTAKVADFGLSKLLPQSALTHITTGVKGTFGYLDPEYAETERLTEKSDVYSFGIMLLELLTGHKSIEQHDGEYVHIAQWAKPYITTGTLANILDKKLGDIKDKETVEEVANIALKCVAYRSTERPLFQEVLQVLEAALKVESPQQALPPSAADVSIDVHTVVPIIAGSNNRDESIVDLAHETI